jgi:hypothetical protein
MVRASDARSASPRSSQSDRRHSGADAETFRKPPAPHDRAEPDNRHQHPPARESQEPRVLHVYVAPLVQEIDGREVVLWDGGPVVAWDEGDAVMQAAFNLIRSPWPILLRAEDPKPRLRVRRVEPN